jgi:uncharacterized protein (DUF2164 family)
MAVKMMQREVTSTKVEFAKLTVVEGQPEVTKDSSILVGNVDAEKALKILTKEMGSGLTILSTEVETQVYEMSVEDFISFATIKEVKEKPEV